MKDGAPKYKNMPIQVSSIQLKVMLHSSGKRTQTKNVSTKGPILQRKQNNGPVYGSCDSSKIPHTSAEAQRSTNDLISKVLSSTLFTLDLKPKSKRSM